MRHITAGPFEGLDKEDLPGQLCAFASGVMRTAAARPAGHYDLVHSHYWLSGQVGWLAADRWQVPLVHTMHTMARVKNLALADGDTPEPSGREIGEQQVVDAADRLVANTADEAHQLVEPVRRAQRPDQRRAPRRRPRALLAGRAEARAAARAALDVPPDAQLLLFVGRIQPLKAPDVLLRATAGLLEREPRLRSRLVVAVVGGPSGSGLREPESPCGLARQLGISDVVRFEPPASRRPARRLVPRRRRRRGAVYNESFGLVALEAQACGTPVVATDVGGLRDAVADGRSGLLVPGHEAGAWADRLARCCATPSGARALAAGAVDARRRVRLGGHRRRAARRLPRGSDRARAAGDGR